MLKKHCMLLFAWDCLAWLGRKWKQNEVNGQGSVLGSVSIICVCSLWSGWWSKTSSWSLTMIMPWTRVHWVSGWEDLIQTIMKVFSPSGNRSSRLVGKLRSSHHQSNHCELSIKLAALNSRLPGSQVPTMYHKENKKGVLDGLDCRTWIQKFFFHGQLDYLGQNFPLFWHKCNSNGLFGFKTRHKT